MNRDMDNIHESNDMHDTASVRSNQKKSYPFDKSSQNLQSEVEPNKADSQNDDLPELEDYEQINGRLQEIQYKIENDEMSLDESLDLYEEAVALGMKATKTINQNVVAHLKKDDDELDVVDGEGAVDGEAGVDSKNVDDGGTVSDSDAGADGVANTQKPALNSQPSDSSDSDEQVN